MHCLQVTQTKLLHFVKTVVYFSEGILLGYVGVMLSCFLAKFVRYIKERSSQNTKFVLLQ